MYILNKLLRASLHFGGHREDPQREGETAEIGFFRSGREEESEEGA